MYGPNVLEHFQNPRCTGKILDEIPLSHTVLYRNHCPGNTPLLLQNDTLQK